jgi:hypothetical protein
MAIGAVPLTAVVAMPQAATAASAATVQASTQPNPIGGFVTTVVDDVVQRVVDPILCNLWQDFNRVPNPGLCMGY